jgi:outer membrane protein assembly factor BamE (lipoprotein component of BamABCDE complex)
MNRLLSLLAVVLMGCATPSSVPRRIAQLHIGMTEREVTNLLGQPRTTSNMGALVVYDYFFTEPIALHASDPPTMSYYVIVGKDGRVRSFGPN